MNERDWLLLKVLMEEKSITQTAKRLFFSQPALSARIRQIEKEFGCQIVIRDTKGITLTTEGELLGQYAQQSIRELQRIKDCIDNVHSDIQGTLRIGCSNIYAKYKLPTILKEFAAKYPKVDIQLVTGLSQRVYHAVLSGQIHLGIIRGEYSWVGERKLLHEDYYCVVSAQDIDIDKLPSLPLIRHKTDKPLQMALDTWWFSRFKEPPRVSMEVDGLDVCIQMVAHGLGYSLLSELCVGETGNLKFARLQFPDDSNMTRKTWAIMHEETKKNRLVGVFYEFLEDHNQI